MILGREGGDDAEASVGFLDSIQFYVLVARTGARRVVLDHEDASADDLAGILRIILEHNDVPSDKIDLGVDGSDEESIDLEALVQSISPDLEISSSTYGDIQVTNEQAIAIVEAVWGD